MKYNMSTICRKANEFAKSMSRSEAFKKAWKFEKATVRIAEIEDQIFTLNLCDSRRTIEDSLFINSLYNEKNRLEDMLNGKVQLSDEERQSLWDEWDAILQQPEPKNWDRVTEIRAILLPGVA